MKTAMNWLGTSALILSVLVVGACSGPREVADTPENRLEQAGTLARIFVEAGSLDRTLDAGADLASDYTGDILELDLGRDLTDDERLRVRDIMRTVLGEFLTVEMWESTVAEALAERLTAAETQEIVAFFESPAGKRFMEIEAPLSDQVDDHVIALLEARFDEFADRVDEEVSRELGINQEGAE